MNLLSKIALLFGRKKFEDFAQANPALPDDALAIANTLDTYPARGAVALVAGSLAQALDNLLRGTETIDAAATHALLVLAALCIIWVRHAISKHDVRVNQVVQKARDISGITARTLLLIFAPFVFFVVKSPVASAQTNAVIDDTFSQLVMANTDVKSLQKSIPNVPTCIMVPPVAVRILSCSLVPDSIEATVSWLTGHTRSQ